MEFISCLWGTFFLILLGGLGVFFVLSPGKVVQLLAKLQETLFHVTGVRDEDIKETPEKHKLLILWIRIFGFFVLFSTLLGSCLFFMAMTANREPISTHLLLNDSNRGAFDPPPVHPNLGGVLGYRQSGFWWAYFEIERNLAGSTYRSKERTSYAL